MPNNIIRQDFGSLGNDVQTQMLIAPVLAEMIATQAFAINDQFIVDNVLYKATKAIAIGDTISVGTSTTDNCVLSDSITQQIGNRTLKKGTVSGTTSAQGRIAGAVTNNQIVIVFANIVDQSHVVIPYCYENAVGTVIWGFIVRNSENIITPIANTNVTINYYYIEKTD